MQNFDLDLKLAELKINGFAVFEDLVPVEKIDRIREAFMPLLETVREREGTVRSDEVGYIRTGRGRLQNPHRYTLVWPFEPPFDDPEIYENPVILEFLERYWGSDDFQITCLHSNNPYPGSVHQKWHRDMLLMSPGVGIPDVPHFGVKFPLVDTCEENGSIEFLPSTQYLAEPELESQYNELLERGSFSSKCRLNIKRGTFYVADPRTLHRGTPNISEAPRPEFCICYSRSWFTIGAKRDRGAEMTRAKFDDLSDRGRNLFSRAYITESI